MPRPLLRALIASYVVALAFALVRLPRVGEPTELDSAWQGLLFSDWQRGARAGVDSVFTYGPTGWLLAQYTFTVDGLVARFVAAWLVAIATALALLSIVRHLPGRPWRLCYLLLLLLLAPSLEFSNVFQAMVALGVAALLAVTAPTAATGAASGNATSPRAIALLVAAALLFAVAGLAKFTYFALACCLVAAIGVALAGVGRFRLAAATPGLFAAAIAAVWLASGQSLADFPTWLHASAEIASGYNESMGRRGDFAETLHALVLLGVLAALALTLLWTARRTDADRRWTAPANVRRTAAMAAVLVGQLLCWKAGFVRQDPGHTAIFFGFTTTAALQLLAAAGLARVPLPIAIALAGAIVAGAWRPLAALAHYRMYLHPDDWRARSVALRRPDVYVDYCRHFLLAMQNAPALPRLRERVGDEAVDMLGFQQGLLLASGFQVRHRPVLQGYSAYTPWLQQLNGAFFRGPGAPRFALANLQSIDDRLPTTEDSQAWLALLEDYHPTMIEQDIVLMERNADRAVLLPPRLVVDRRAAWGEWVEVPQGDDWHELALDIDFTLLGRAAAALYRIDRLHLEVRLADGAQSAFTIAPCLVRAPFLLDPLLRGNADFVRTWSGAPPPRVAALRIVGDPARAYQFRQDGIGVQIYARSFAGHALPDSGPGSIERVVDSRSFPGFQWLPYRVEPQANLRAAPDAGVRAHGPCTLFFRWPGGRHRIVAEFELPQAAYTGTLQSDGAAFRVEVADGSQERPRRIAFERLLNPLERAADRGVQSLSVALDLPADTVVALVTHPGPSGAVEFDCTTWRKVALDRD